MLAAFLAYLVGVGLLGWLAHRYLSGGSFVQEYFLGNRQLGTWVLAISFAATAISGGTFMGFPALIYTNGWILALWIAGYMLVPLTTMAVLGKRINQASRLSGAVTIPDILRDRYESPTLGLLTSCVLILFLGVNLVAQFKAGGLLMLEAWRDTLEGTGLIELVWRGQGQLAEEHLGYVLGLVFFVAMVVAYTAYGGFWGVTLTDVLEGLVMLVGAVALAVLALDKVGGLEAATRILERESPLLVHGPGPPVKDATGKLVREGFLTPFLALSFFFQWTIIGIAQPGQMVRLMSFKNTSSLKKALCLCAVYYSIIYAALLVIFICARALYPPASLGAMKTDDIMPFMIRQLAAPHSTLLAGFLLAAPYAAIMSTVAAYLLIVSSSLVRDLYQRFVAPDAPTRTLRRLSYTVTTGVGVLAFFGALWPPTFLQRIIVFSTEGLGVSLLAPVLLGLYWPRATARGALAGLGAGLMCHLGLYSAGFSVALLASLPVSFAAMVGLSLATQPARAETLARYFPPPP